MTTTPKADALTEQIRPLMAEGNEHAVAAWLRMAIADDPEAEVDRIIEDYADLCNRLAEVVMPFVRLYHDVIGPN